MTIITRMLKYFKTKSLFYFPLLQITRIMKMILRYTRIAETTVRLRTYKFF